MNEKMDINMDYPSFDQQSIHVSFEERRLLYIQLKANNQNEVLIKFNDLHKRIRGHDEFTLISTPSTLTSKPKLNNTYGLYYTSLENGSTDNEIDLLRLYYQQLFQLTFKDLCSDANYRFFILMIEALVFYASQTVKQYEALMRREMTKHLTSFITFMDSRSTKINDVLSYLTELSIPWYGMVHTISENNSGMLLHILPKINYPNISINEHKSIVTLDEYARHTLSPEELRYLEYSLNVKSNGVWYKNSQVHPQPLMKRITLPQQQLGFFGQANVDQSDRLVCHSLPIIYPYSDDMVYREKYPKFWTSNIQSDENADVLFCAVSLDKNTHEYRFIERFFSKTIPTNAKRIECIDRIENPHLWEKLCSHRLYLRRKNGHQNLNENWLFHGTNSDNHMHIMTHGFNRSYCKDTVLFGRGVYFSRFASYSARYADCKELSSMFLCRVLVGNHVPGSPDIRTPPSIVLPNGKNSVADSTTNHQNPYTIVCTFHDDQAYPEYIITFSCTNVNYKCN